MSLIETIRAKLVNYKADLVEFPYEFADRKLIQFIKNSGVYAVSKDYLSTGDIVFLNENTIAVGLDNNIHSSMGNDFLDLFIDFENNIIVFSTSKTTNYCFNKTLLPTLDDENIDLARYVAKEVMPAILAMRLIS